MRQKTVGDRVTIASHSHPALAGWSASIMNLVNRFNGFSRGSETKPLKRLMRKEWHATTQLKQGVNESTYKFLERETSDREET